MKSIVIFVSVFLIHLISWSQHGYIQTDSTMTVGLKIIDGGEYLNSKFCVVKSEDSLIKYTPYDIREYGFDDRKVFVAMDMHLLDTLQRIFLERIYSGKTVLYHFRGDGFRTFFLQKQDSSLVEVPRRSSGDTTLPFRESLQHITADCPFAGDPAKLVRYNKPSMVKLVKRYDLCIKRPFPVYTIGISAGYGISSLLLTEKTNNSKLHELDPIKDNGWVLGIFVDLPILASDFSLHTDLMFSQNGYMSSNYTEDADIDFIANTTTFSLPFLFRYRIPTNGVRPFFNAGGVFSYHVKTETTLYEAFIDNDPIITGNADTTLLVPPAYVGFSLGGGIEFHFLLKNSIFLEARYTREYGISIHPSLNESLVYLIAGINL